MFLVDSHCHLDYDPMAKDINKALSHATEQNVKGFLTICTHLSKIPLLESIVESHGEVFSTVGVHPHEAKDTLPPKELFTALVKTSQHPKMVGFGETGLDYYYKNSPKEAQLSAFKTHIETALECDLPLIVHTRDAEEDTIDLLKNVGQGKVKGILHCFTGSPWLRDKALELGFYISASGIITFKKSTELRDTIKEVPVERLLVETDAPFLAPEPYRGKSNEPAFVVEVAKKLAEIKGVSFNEVCKQTTQNFLTLFSKVTFSCA